MEKHNFNNNLKYQNTFVFKSNPKCVFVKDDSLKTITTFDEMDFVQLTNQEMLNANKEREKIISNGKYDGNLFFTYFNV